jgi:replicative DNA helicase
MEPPRMNMHSGITTDPLTSVEAEAALLSALMIDNGLIDRLSERVAATDFNEPLLGRIYAAIVREASLGRAANPISIKPYFNGDPAFEEMNGIAFLADLTSQHENVVGAREFANQIADLSKRRAMRTGLNEALGRLNETASAAIAEVIDVADAALVGAADSKEGLQQLTGAACIDEVLAGFDEPMGGVRCGVIGSLDDLTRPLQPKQLVVMAGRPGMGKSAVAGCYGVGAAARGHGVLFVSLEMSAKELGARMAADICHAHNRPVLFERIVDSNVADQERRSVAAARDVIKNLPIEIVDADHMTISRLAMIARRHKRRLAAQGQSFDLLIVDYLQLVQPDSKTRSVYEAVSAVSMGMKALAKGLGVTILCLAQLNRAVEGRDDKRPMLPDLRDSGQIEQDADAILFLHREEYYLKQREPQADHKDREAWEKMMQAAAGKIDFILAKRRNGRTGHAWGYFFGEHQAVRGSDFYRTQGQA